VGKSPAQSPDSDPESADRLSSWKDTAAYFQGDVRTVRRWESELGLPVHRRPHTIRGIVFAYRSELDVWLNNGHPRLQEQKATPAAQRDLRAAGLALAGVLLLAGGYWTWRRFGSRAAPTPPLARLAVLPLENLSGDPGQEYFADGMTDELITDLAKISSLQLISRTSVMSYKGTRKPLREIARELGVDAVVEGSVTHAGDKVRVTAQLIDARTDRHLWADDYEENWTDILSLQEPGGSRHRRGCARPADSAGAHPVDPRSACQPRGLRVLSARVILPQSTHRRVGGGRSRPIRRRSASVLPTRPPTQVSRGVTSTWPLSGWRRRARLSPRSRPKHSRRCGMIRRLGLPR